jgi:D-lactate dehydrogenase (cytochrome)
MGTADDALALLTIAQERCGAALTAFELMSAFCMALVERHFPQLRLPLQERQAHYVLLELSDSESEAHANALLESVIGNALERGVITDAAVASSIAQSKTLWHLREHIPLAQAQEGKNIKHDISVPISRIGDFIRTTDLRLTERFPGCRLVTFGHLGDGNLHYNVSPPEGVADAIFMESQDAVNRVVHDSVQDFGGSISAEHGLGALKREEITRYKSPVELGLMRTVKQALDPLGIMNPGKVI